jgi:Oligosaccharyl transferase STT3, N-terminal
MPNNNRVIHTIATFLDKNLILIAISLCLLCGLLLRSGTFAYIQETPEAVFLDQEPLIGTLDGYFYLKNTKDLLNNTYSSIDHQRAYPDGASLPNTPSLLSVLLATITRITPSSLHWAAALLPPILGLLLAVPIFAFGMHWGGRNMAIFAVLLSLVSYSYATRTAFGMLDTDCLNVTFPFAIAFCFMRFGSIEKYYRYFYFITGIILSFLFLWWWNLAPSVVTAFSIVPLYTALLFFYRPPKREAICFFSFFLIVLFTVFLFVGLDTLKEHANNLLNLYRYVTKNSGLSSSFPNTSLSNMEQIGSSFSSLAENTIGNMPMFLVASAGLIWLSIKKFKDFIYLLPLVIVGGLSLTSLRFFIFLSPLMALGFAYFISQIFTIFPNIKIRSGISVCLFFFLAGQGLADPPMRTSFYNPTVLKGMKNTKKLTEKDAVIYSWWDAGHPLLFWSNRATIADGYIHGGERTTYLGIPYATNNFRLSANFITFFSTRGIKGIHYFLSQYDGNQKEGLDFIKAILANGPNNGKHLIATSSLNDVPFPPDTTNWLDFFFPGNPKPTYFFIESRQMKPVILRWNYWYGTWNTVTQKGDTTLPTIMLADVPEYQNGKLEIPMMSLDETNGTIFINGAFEKPINLKSIAKFNGSLSEKFNYITPEDSRISTPKFTQNHSFNDDEKQYFSSSGQYTLELFPKPYLSYLQDTKLSNTVVKQLFFYKKHTSQPYFKLVDEKHLQYQLWEVKSETAYPE